MSRNRSDPPAVTGRPETKISPGLRPKPLLMFSGAGMPIRVSLANPPSKPMRVPSKFRTGPAMVIPSSVQVFPPCSRHSTGTERQGPGRLCRPQERAPPGEELQ